MEFLTYDCTQGFHDACSYKIHISRPCTNPYAKNIRKNAQRPQIQNYKKSGIVDHLSVDRNELPHLALVRLIQGRSPKLKGKKKSVSSEVGRWCRVTFFAVPVAGSRKAFGWVLGKGGGPTLEEVMRAG
jgi:hypothetical protein